MYFFKNEILILLIVSVFAANVFAQYESNNVSLVGRWPFGDCRTVFNNGNYVYIGNGTCLDVLDVSNSEVPTLIGRLITESIISGVFIDGSYAYVANWSNGFRVVDINNPNEPVEIASILFEGQCWGVSVFGDYAFVSNDTLGMRIVDISNPEAPSLTGTFAPDGFTGAEQIEVVDTLAYMVSKDGLYIVNISQPDEPELLSYSPTSNTSWHIKIIGDIAYIAEFYYGVRLIDISDPVNPLDLGYFDTPGSALWVEFSGNYAYVADADSGIYVLDISNPATPDSILLVNTSYVYSLHIQGTYLYVSCYDEGFRIFNISNPQAPLEVGFYDTGGYQMDVYASNNFIYAAQFRRGIGIIDNTIPNSPVEIVNMHMPFSQKIHGSGNYVYIVSDYTLKIIDVTNPDLPQQVASWEPNGYVADVYVSGSYAYLCGSPRLSILDISNPNSPSEVASFNSVPPSRYIYVSGNYVYLTCGFYGLHIIDITNFAEINEVGSFDDVDYLRAVQVIGNYAYVTDHYLGLMRIIDISNPEMPFEVSNFQTEEARDLYISGDFAYLINPWTGLRVIDISDPNNPFECGFFNTGGFAYGVYVDEFIYVADGGGGIYILQNDLLSDIEDKTHNPFAFSLNQNYPNPFNPSTKIQYVLPRSSKITMEIINLLGQKIETLVNRQMPAGTHEVEFNAKNLPSGVYYYRIEAGELIEVKKMILLR